MLRTNRLASKFLLSAAPLLLGLVPVLARDIPKKVETRCFAIIQEALTAQDSVVRELAVQALEYVDGEPAKKALLSSLRDESDYVRIWAARSLVAKGDRSGRDPLLSILLTVPESPKDATGPLAALVRMRALAQGRLRGEAAKVLGRFNDESLIPVLKNAMRDNDGRVRDGAAVALALMGDTSQGYVFASALKDQDKGVRLAALEALEAMGDGRFADPVEATLQDPEVDVRNIAARALGNMKAASAAESLSAKLTDENGLVRESAAESLGMVGAKEKSPNLKASLNDPNLYVRIAAAHALGRLGDTSGLPVIEAALASNDTDGRIKAAFALDTISSPQAQSLAIKTLDDGNLRVRLGAAASLLKP
jgi:HEAT repeat protein